MAGRVAVALLLVVLGAGPVASAAELPAADLWTRANAAADAGDFEEANKRLNELFEQGTRTGIERYPLLASSAASLAEQALAEQNAVLAEWAIEAAARLDPASAAVSFSAADLAKRQGNWAGAVRGVLSGIAKLPGDYTSSVLARNNFVLVIMLAVGLTAIALALSLLFRYGGAATHDFRETLGGRLSAGVTTVLAFAVLFLPIFLWLGPVWLVLWWLALLFPYGSWREKTAIAVVLIVVAIAPLVLDRSASRIAGVQSPVVQAAAADLSNAWDASVLLRLQALMELMPEEPLLHLLAGNLYVQQGSDEEAQIHYRRAVQLDQDLAGAHLNIGNLHFLNNDYTAAISRYERAGSIDKDMALAPYNHSLAAGELYRFDEQGRHLEEARRRDRSLVDQLTQSSSQRGLKVVMYELPMSTAWALADQISRSGQAREVYGNYALFDPLRTLRNPLTGAALLMLLIAVALWLARRGGGFAGSCIKCGRTFCRRCKSARESATYCTQCIHIYLKRDGVAVDTKRKKLEEVQEYQHRTVRNRKLLGTILPGSPRVLSGSPFLGAGVLLLFLIFVSLAVLIGRLAPLGPSPDTMRLLVRLAALAAAFLIWSIFTIPVYREKAGV